eukprot:jgi/Chlat1/8275/Chrsp78S07729
MVVGEYLPSLLQESTPDRASDRSSRWAAPDRAPESAMDGVEKTPITSQRAASNGVPDSNGSTADVRSRDRLSSLRLALQQDALQLYSSQTFPGRSLRATPAHPTPLLVAAAEELGGYTAMAASELEYYLFNESYQQAHKQGHHQLTPVGWQSEDYHTLQGTREEFFNAPARRHLSLSGVPVENSKGEFGHGQHELNVKYTNALTMADRHVVYKQCLKELAEKLGVSVTFMAKPHAEQAGSGCHIHLSLQKDGRNAFVGDESITGAKGSVSKEFRWFLGGWMKHTPDLMVFYAPNVNSYKRFVAGSWAPTRIAWSQDNRTSPFRVVGHGSALRIECRLPGADCNPYLAFAAALASGLDGIRNRIEPPAGASGNVYNASELQHVPRSLAKATERFASSAFAVEMLGEDVHHHYTHFFRTEQLAYDSAVTSWERERYFEQI